MKTHILVCIQEGQLSIIDAFTHDSYMHAQFKAKGLSEVNHDARFRVLSLELREAPKCGRCHTQSVYTDGVTCDQCWDEIALTVLGQSLIERGLY